MEWAWEWMLEEIAQFAEENEQQYYRVWDDGHNSRNTRKQYGYTLSRGSIATGPHFPEDSEWGELPDWHGAWVDLLVEFWGWINDGYLLTRVFEVGLDTIRADGTREHRLYLNPWTCEPMGAELTFWASGQWPDAFPTDAEPRFVLEPTQ